MIKGILPTNKYHCTVRQSDLTDDSDLRLVWTIDEDTDYAWRNLIDLYPLNEYGLARLQRMCKTLNFEMYPQDHEIFVEQFSGLRGLLSVTVRLDGNYRTNEILEYMLPTQPPHFDVTVPKTEEHFFQNKNKRTLPICPT
jgi:hypothetical protein